LERQKPTKNGKADSLHSLSEKLYQSSTHFLLELIQNADDNTYICDTPTLFTKYRDRRLLVSCNEIGFQKQNVEAICRIGRSTKAATTGTTRYIGEKGIGFKSVFKVADTVWVKSGLYSFRFDKSERLGMIAPSWSSFPDDCPSDLTSIALHLSHGQGDSQLLREIHNLDSRLMIFLRNLRQLNLEVD
jgi:hypothetical protein